MSDAPVTIRPLDDGQLVAARVLLVSANLPVDDLGHPGIELFGAFAGETMTGVIGLQTCGELGLLRSLAVTPADRSRGTGRQLCDHVLAIANARGLPAVWLLTTSAHDYFAARGFESVSRADAPAEIRATAQFSSLCPASAHVMSKQRQS